MRETDLKKYLEIQTRTILKHSIKTKKRLNSRDQGENGRNTQYVKVNSNISIIFLIFGIFECRIPNTLPYKNWISVVANLIDNGLSYDKERQQFKQLFATHSFYNQYFPQVVLMSSALVSYRSQHSTSHSVASFLLKTFEILEKAEFSHIISWTYDDDTFAIKNILQFTNQILPKYFRHRNFSSFVRQLNMYDFHKIKQSNDYIVFRNPLFKKGQSHLLKKIKRKAPKKNQLEKKISSTIGIHRQEENLQLKQSFQISIHESMVVFQKSLLSLETIYSLVQKNQSLFTLIDSPEATKQTTATLLDRVMEVQKLSNISFKSISSINYTIDQCFKQKQAKYSQLQTNLPVLSLKNVSTGSHSKSSQIKSECSIGDHKEEI